MRDLGLSQLMSNRKGSSNLWSYTGASSITIFEVSFSIFSQPSKSCSDNGYLTVFDGGRLGNKMTQYATLLAHASRLGAKPVISSIMKNDLSKHFPQIRLILGPALVKKLTSSL